MVVLRNQSQNLKILQLNIKNIKLNVIFVGFIQFAWGIDLGSFVLYVDFKVQSFFSIALQGPVWGIDQSARVRAGRARSSRRRWEGTTPVNSSPVSHIKDARSVSLYPYNRS